MVYIVIGTLLFLLDTVGKKWADKYGHHSRTFWNDRIKLTVLYNPGAAMGFLKNHKKILNTITAVSMAGITFWFGAVAKCGGKILEKGSLFLAMIGSWNNGYERIKKGEVVDYIQFPKAKGKIKKICFNLSDFYIIIAAIGLLLSSLTKKRP